MARLNMSVDSVPSEIREQVSRACEMIAWHLPSSLRAIHLYGSALDGGLKPFSDIDLLVTVASSPAECVRKAFLRDLLSISLAPDEDPLRRALEVTMVVLADVVPWRYPPRRELQFGEWLRNDILAGLFAPAVHDRDLAILLTKARHSSLAIVGPTADALFEPVPDRDFYTALNDALALWKTPADWAGDERNIVLTVARIWYSAETRLIAPKDVAADWVAKRLPAALRPLVLDARLAYLGHRTDDLAARTGEMEAFIRFARAAISDLLSSHRE